MRKKKDKTPRRSPSTASISSTAPPPPAPLAGMRVCLFRTETLMISDDLELALRALGCRTRSFTIAMVKKPMGAGFHFDQSIEGHCPFGAYVFREIDRFDPHLIVCVNGYGFDDALTLIAIAELKEIPLVNWFVDDPEILSPSHVQPAARFLVNAVFDRAHAEQLKKRGCERTFYLPLGAVPAKFARDAAGAATWRPPAPVVFVGNAGLDLWDRSFSQIVPHIQGDAAAIRCVIAEEIGRCADWLEQNPGASISEHIEHDVATQAGKEFYGFGGFRNALVSLVEFQASFQARKRILNGIDAAKVAVVGGADWDGHLNGPARVEPVPYKNIGQVYRAAPINLNVTRYHLKTAVNQRVFDVPAAGGFLLTDYRSCMDEMFEIGKEIVCYRGLADLNEKIRYYLERPGERAEIVRRGRERIAREHTYEHRALAMIEAVRSFGLQKGALGPGHIMPGPLPIQHATSLACLAEEFHHARDGAMARRLMATLPAWGHPDFPYNQLAIALVQMSRGDEALSVMDASIAASPRASVCVSAGLLALQANHKARAIAYARKALSLDPNDAEARALLAKCEQ